MEEHARERIREELKKYGREESWDVLVYAIDDLEFRSYLTEPEENILSTTKNNPSSIGGNRNHLVGIISKYFAYIAAKETKITKLEKSVSTLTDKVDTAREDLENIKKVANLASGASALQSYANVFQDRAVSHSIKAKSEFKRYLLSLLLFLAIMWAVFFLNISEYTLIGGLIADDMMLPFSVGVFGFKAAALLFAFQIAQLFRRLHSAEKHLEETYQHRADVLNSLHAVYVSLNEPLEKDKLLTAGALFAYERGETGFITTKEGAGSSDDFIGSILNQLTRR